MDAYKLAVKFVFEDPAEVKLEEFAPVFHRWIQTRALDGHLLIDVADYKHVHEGPGVVLISHEANIYADVGGGQLGLLYVRKQPLSGSFVARLREVFRYALLCAAMLEDEPSLKGRVQFRTNEIIFRIHDRLLAPNEPRTFELIKGDLDDFLRQLYSTPTVQLIHRADPQKLFEVEIRTSESAPVHSLLERAAAGPSSF